MRAHFASRYDVTFTFEYKGANIIACNVVQKFEGGATVSYNFTSKNRIYISDNGTPERINNTVFLPLNQ